MNRLRRWPWWQIGIALLVAIAGGAMSAAAFIAARSTEEQRIQQQLDFRADWRANDIAARLQPRFALILSAATMIAATPDPTPAAFEEFVRGRLAYAGEPPRILYWAPRVLDSQRAAFEANARAGGATDFAIREPETDQSARSVPAQERAEYYPALLQVNFAGPVTAVGGDAASDAGRRAAIQRAVDTGGLQTIGPATPAATLATQAAGVTVYAPVYNSRGIPDDVAARRAGVRGVVGARFDLAPLLDAAIAHTPDGMASIYVLGQAPAEGREARVAADYDPRRGTIAATAAPLDPATLTGYRTLRSFTIGGETWHLLFHFPRNATAALRSLGPWAWLAAGLLATAAAVGLALAVLARGSRLRLPVDEGRAQVSRLDAQLQARAADLEAIVDASPMAIIALNAAGQVQIWSRAAERIFGITANEAIGKPYPVVPDSEIDHFTRHFDEILGGRKVTGIEGPHRRKDGRQIQVRFSGAPLRAGNGHKRGVLYVVDDVTQQKATAAQLQHAEKLETLGQLTGGLAHDFNNLLGVVIGNLDMLETQVGERDAATSALVEDSLSAALKGAELTRSLLAFARRQPLRAAKLDANAILDSIAPLIRRSLGERYEIALCKSADLWQTTADPAQLEAAILNLCVNARDAMADGGTLTIETRNAHLDADYVAANPGAQAGDYVGLSITDTGSGMSEEVLARALEPFFTTKGVGKGSGLGLSMVFGFVKQSGGHFKLYSEVGHGTAAKIYLPRAVAAGASAAPDAPAARLHAGAHGKILVVDDNEQMRKVVTRQLHELGYETIDAVDGPSALRLLSDGVPIDLLFTDVVMPGMTGYELARSARALRPGLKVLFTSGFPAAAQQVGGAASEGRLLSKPYRRDELAHGLRATLDAERRPGA